MLVQVGTEAPLTLKRCPLLRRVRIVSLDARSGLMVLRCEGGDAGGILSSLLRMVVGDVAVGCDDAFGLCNGRK
jgi:hypothetical protein